MKTATLAHALHLAGIHYKRWTDHCDKQDGRIYITPLVHVVVFHDREGYCVAKDNSITPGEGTRYEYWPRRDCLLPLLTDIRQAMGFIAGRNLT